MGREVGGGIGMGKTCEPKAFSFQCMTKFTTNKKKQKTKNKKKIRNKKYIYIILSFQLKQKYNLLNILMIFNNEYKFFVFI